MPVILKGEMSSLDLGLWTDWQQKKMREAAEVEGLFSVGSDVTKIPAE